MLLTKEASTVFYAQRTSYNLDFEKPSNLKVCQVVKEINETGAVFEDGESCEVDTIIYATGYKYSFPFLNPECGIRVEEEHIQFLYKHLLNVKYPSMAFVGMNFLVLPQLLFDLQSQFVMELWTGRTPIPTEEEMVEDMQRDLQKRLDKGWSTKHAHMLFTLSEEYHNEISDAVGLPRTPAVYHRLMEYFAPRSKDDYLHYRDECYEVLDGETFRTFYK